MLDSRAVPEHDKRMENSAVLIPAAAGQDRSAGALRVSFGYAGQPCGKALSEDFLGMIVPDGEQLARRGIVVALADGVSASKGGGRIAAESAVHSLLADYYATPEHWEVAQALDKVLEAVNAWLFAENARRPAIGGLATTLSLIVLRGRQVFLGHVGDTRIYRVRDNRMEQLSTDHVWPRWDMRHTLRRALGLDQHLIVDYSDDMIEPGDTFLLLSDGVWESAGERDMREIVASLDEPQAIADALVERAVSYQKMYFGRNDATAAALRVDAL
ncbi:MAG TPA: PP2C family serine/threonine-protein phosphatase [Burkholderiales bacterium]|nr:PP2C family serine/threonine-protein phosphatase [Burkholderiales bacterium]